MCDIGLGTLPHETLNEDEDDVGLAGKTAEGMRPAEIDWWGAATQWGSALDGTAWGGRSAKASAPPDGELADT